MGSISGRASACALMLGASLAATAAAAQVTLDGTANPNFTGPVRLEGREYRIGARLGRLADKNLFHSFERFDLRTGERATFRGPAQVERIISRVTGGDPSDIDGTIRSTIAGADFYFLNPAGVMFGPNARLDVKGSFHVSTADELRFADGAVFSADRNASSSFTVARPEAFGFLGRDRGALSVQDSWLRVRPGEAISLVGGDVTIAGGSADDDNPTIGASRGTVTVGAVGAGGGQFTIRSGRLESSGRAAITVTDGTFLDTTGNGAGLIRIRGGRVVIRGGSSILSNNNGNRNAPARNGVNVDAQILRLRGGSLLFADVINVARGSGGNVIVRADVVELTGASQVTADTSASGNAGSVTVTAAERVRVRSASLIASDSRPASSGNAGEVRVAVADGLLMVHTGVIRSNTDGVGNAGAVRVIAKELIVQGDAESGNPALISSDTIGSGNSGEIRLDATRIDIMDVGIVNSNTMGPGNGGEIIITAEQINVANGAEISSGTTSSGNAGVVSIQVAEQLSIQGGDAAFAGIFSNALQGSRGNAGEVSVTAGEIEVLDGGQIASDARGSGNAGQISISADRSLLIRGSPETLTGVFSEADPGSRGNAGSIVITAAEGVVEVRDDGVIRTSTFGPGNAGDIVITADRVIGRSRISAEPMDGATGRGGNVTINAPDVEILRNGVISSSTSGRGDAGTVSIVAERLVLSDGGRIASDSGDRATGNAGEVEINASDIEIRDGGQITATTAGSGLGGDVRVGAGQIMVMGDGSAISSGTGGSTLATGGTVVVVAGGAVLVLDGAEIRASTSGGADAGSIDVEAREVSIEGNGSAIASEAARGSPGASGDVTLRASEITIRDGGDVSSSNQGTGSAGSVTIGADQTMVLDGGSIRTVSASAGGGELIIRGEGLVAVQRGQISTEVSGGDDPIAGNIVMDPEVLVIDESSTVRTRAPKGSGGNIRIEASTMFVPGGDRDTFLKTGAIDASGETGNLNGTVALNAPEIDLSGGLVVLEGALLDAASLLRERCGARRDIGASSFTGVGRGGLPPSPDGPLSSSYARGVNEAGLETRAFRDGGSAELAPAPADAAFEASAGRRQETRTAGLATFLPCRGVL